MSQPHPTEALLIDLLRSQEAMRLELSRLANLCETQARELNALKDRQAAYSPPQDAFLALPFGLLTPRGTPAAGNKLASVWRDLAGTFAPPPSSLLPKAAYILYRQIQGLDISAQRIAVITTPRTQFAEVLAVTKAATAVELRLHSIDGPVEIIEYDRNTPPVSTFIPVGLQALPWSLQNCDLLWIPDPFLASLALQCRGVFEGFAEQVRHHVLFSLNAEDWRERDARLIAHSAGFIEVSRPFDSGEKSYITRMHENLGCYPLTEVPKATESGPLYLLASKIPTPAFIIHQTDEASREST